MKSIVSEQYCKDIKRGKGWEVGLLEKYTGLSELGLKQPNILCGRFDGLRTFIDAVEKNSNDFGFITQYNDSQETSYAGDWVKYPTYQTALNAFIYTPEKFRNFTEADIRLKDWDQAGNDVEYGVVGDFLDIGRVVEGDPEPFGIMKDGNINTRFCTILVNMSLVWSTTPEEAGLKAMRIVRLIDMLEANHTRCRVIGMEGDNVSYIEITIKDYSDKLDLDDLCIAFDADFQRRVVFKFKERSPTCEWGYGSVQLWGRCDTVKKIFDDGTADNIITIDGFNSSSHTEENQINKKFDLLEKKIKDGFEVGENYTISFN